MIDEKNKNEFILPAFKDFNKYEKLSLSSSLISFKILFERVRFSDNIISK